ncbi:MAG: hypothetical protein ACKOS8_14645, partial [Gemmataceae bacterium]
LGVTPAWGHTLSPEDESPKSMLLPLALEPSAPATPRQWWRPFELESVNLAVNRVEATFRPAKGSGLFSGSDSAPEPLRIYVAYMENHLQAWIDRPAWMDHLSDEKRHALAWSLAWIYRAAGVEVARETLELLAPPGTTQTRLDEDRVIFTVADDFRVTYRLADQGRAWHRIPETAPAQGSPTAPEEVRPAWRALFGEMPFTWSLFVDRWTAGANGQDFGQVRLDGFWIDLLGDTGAGKGTRGLRLSEGGRVAGA